MPARTFLLVRLRASVLGSRPVQAAFATRPRLDGLLLEVRGDAVGMDLAVLRERGARIAQAADVRPVRPDQVPDIVVLDQGAARIAAGSDVDAVPGAPRLLAEGVDTADDLTAARRCGAALARGWLFGPPSAVPGPLPACVTELVRARLARIRVMAPVLGLVQPVRHVPAPASGIAPALELDEDGAPVSLLLEGPAGSTWRKPVTLNVMPGDGVGETLRLALSRPAEHRRDPVVCTDEAGRPLGLIRVADLVRAAAF